MPNPSSSLSLRDPSPSSPNPSSSQPADALALENLGPIDPRELDDRDKCTQYLVGSKYVCATYILDQTGAPAAWFVFRVSVFEFSKVLFFGFCTRITPFFLLFFSQKWERDWKFDMVQRGCGNVYAYALGSTANSLSRYAV